MNFWNVFLGLTGGVALVVSALITYLAGVIPVLAISVVLGLMVGNFLVRGLT